MTAGPDVSVEELRSAVAKGLQATIDDLAGSYAAPLALRTRGAADGYAAAVLCLGLGRLGGEERKAMPCALALALLEEMGRVLLGLEGGSSINGAWGMPRTLNAADGLYALGRHVLLTHEALDASSRLQALSTYTGAAREFSEALHAHAPEGDGAFAKATRSLRPAAVSLASVCCGFDDETRRGLTESAALEPIETVLENATRLTLRGA